MFKKDILDNPITLFIVVICISLINILSSIHFIPIMFVGILFIAFIKMIESKSYYLLLWIVLGFLIVENIQGFKAFSLVALSLFIYLFIKPTIQNVFLSRDILKYINIFIFYISMIFLYSFINSFDTLLLSTIMINLLLDIIIVGLFI